MGHIRKCPGRVGFSTAPSASTVGSTSRHPVSSGSLGPTVVVGTVLFTFLALADLIRSVDAFPFVKSPGLKQLTDLDSPKCFRQCYCLSCPGPAVSDVLASQLCLQQSSLFPQQVVCKSLMYEPKKSLRFFGAYRTT